MDISGYLWVVAKDVMARLPFGFAIRFVKEIYIKFIYLKT